jgi:arylsulfatase
VKNKSHSIEATIDMPKEGGDGVLVAAGGIVAGYTLFIKDRKPVYEYNWFSQSRYRAAGSKALPPGPATVRVEFEYDGGGAGKGGTAKLFVNGESVGETRVDKTVPARYSADETFDIGMDTGSPVSNDYASPNRFTGKLKKVDIVLGDSGLSEEDVKKVKAMEDAAAIAAH